MEVVHTGQGDDLVPLLKVHQTYNTVISLLLFTLLCPFLCALCVENKQGQIIYHLLLYAMLFLHGNVKLELPEMRYYLLEFIQGLQLPEVANMISPLSSSTHQMNHIQHEV